VPQWVEYGAWHEQTDSGGDGGVFHVTHRCHNREFLLKFVRDRNAYQAKLLRHLGQYHLCILDYCMTSNHLHLLVDESGAG
jgi:putative transposase